MSKKSGLLNNAQPDTQIFALQSKYPDLYRALKNFSSSVQDLIDQVFPRSPVLPFEWRFSIATPTVGNDVLPSWFHVVMPNDPSNNWTYVGVQLFSTDITTKVVGAAVDTKIDIKLQRRGTTTWKTLYKSGAAPDLPPNVHTAHNVEFAVGNLVDDDLLRVDVLAVDGAVSGVEVVLDGAFVLIEKN